MWWITDECLNWQKQTILLFFNKIITDLTGCSKLTLWHCLTWLYFALESHFGPLSLNWTKVKSRWADYLQASAWIFGSEVCAILGLQECRYPHSVTFIILASLFLTLIMKHFVIQMWHKTVFPECSLAESAILQAYSKGIKLERGDVEEGSALLLSLYSPCSAFIGSCAGCRRLHPSTKPHTPAAYFANVPAGIFCANAAASGVLCQWFCCKGCKLFKLKTITSVAHALQVRG